MFSIYQVTQDTSDLIGRNLLWCASSMLGFVVRLWGDNVEFSLSRDFTIPGNHQRIM